MAETPGVDPDMGTTGAESREPTVSGFLASSPNRIVSIGVVEHIRSRVLAGRPPEKGRWVVVLAIALSPLVADLIFAALGYSTITQDPRAFGALIYYSFLNIFALTCPYYTWHRLMALGADIDEIVPTQAGRAHLVEWLTRRTSLRRQAWRCLLSVVTCLIMLKLVVAPIIGGVITIGPASYVAVAVAAAVGWEDFYWVTHLPLLVREVCRQPEVRLHWHAPAGTPAVEGLSRLLGWVAVLGTLGGGMVGVTVAFAYSVSAARTVMILAVAAGVGTSAIFLFVGLYPQLLLYKFVSRVKDTSLREVDQQVGELDVSKPDDDLERQARWIGVRYGIDNSPTWTLRNETLVQFLAAVMGVLLSVLLTVVVSGGGQ